MTIITMYNLDPIQLKEGEKLDKSYIKRWIDQRNYALQQDIENTLLSNSEYLQILDNLNLPSLQNSFYSIETSLKQFEFPLEILSQIQKQHSLTCNISSVLPLCKQLRYYIQQLNTAEESDDFISILEYGLKIHKIAPYIWPPNSGQIQLDSRTAISKYMEDILSKAVQKYMHDTRDTKKALLFKIILAGKPNFIIPHFFNYKSDSVITFLNQFKSISERYKYIFDEYYSCTCTHLHQYLKNNLNVLHFNCRYFEYYKPFDSSDLFDLYLNYINDQVYHIRNYVDFYSFVDKIIQNYESISNHRYHLNAVSIFYIILKHFTKSFDFLRPALSNMPEIPETPNLAVSLNRSELDEMLNRLRHGIELRSNEMKDTKIPSIIQEMRSICDTI